MLAVTDLGCRVWDVSLEDRPLNPKPYTRPSCCGCACPPRNASMETRTVTAVLNPMPSSMAAVGELPKPKLSSSSGSSKSKERNYDHYGDQFWLQCQSSCQKQGTPGVDPN